MTALTDHQAKLFALELKRRHPVGDSARIGSALLDAQVDLNPHQVDAALFAFRSPFSKGVILADEVGLGKTIEAGLVLTQRWAERRRRVIVVVPASLRKQWSQELAEKFFLPSLILETKSFNAAMKAGASNPFDLPPDEPAVVICSYQFAARKAEQLATVPWDLAILDEAHRVRNVFKPNAKTALAIRTALSNTPKLLLTATPLQNSLMELYGLVSMIDEHHFGDARSFQAQYSRLAQDGRFEDLKARLEPVCHRTMRRQVVEYVSYTNRVPITQEFWPSEEEQTLYDAVSDYLRRPELKALPNSQRVLMVLVMRKLLASSTFAIAGALDSLARKLQTTLRDDDRARSAETAEDEDIFEGDYETLAEEQEEWPEAETQTEERPPALTEAQRGAISAEIAELGAFRDLAVSINENAKGLALLTALKTGFAKAAALGAANKAVIFTESRRTQAYLIELLSRSGYENEIVLFSGNNNDPGSKAIYRDWKERHGGTDLITGSPTADMRAALVEHFRTTAKIMIATEAAAEGINLQFCSMVVNYDLPWNPQRIEQRIGRCHRYGQKHDVVVINFLNKANAADLRVFELLDEKFRLFSGVFGASDEVLGTIESGVDFERRIVDIYQNCRTTEAINEQFEQLRLEMDDQITQTMDNTRMKLLEHFDAEVHDRLKVSLAESTEFIDKASEQLWRVTAHILRDHADINPASRSFLLRALPALAPEDTALGCYRLTRDDQDDARRYRPQHPLALAVLDEAAKLEAPCAELAFDYSGWPVRSEVIEPLVGSTGTLVAEHLRLNGVEAEDHLVLAAITDDGQALTTDQARRLLDVPATARPAGPSILSPGVAGLAEQHIAALRGDISARQGAWFDDEMDKLDRWAEDKRTGLKAVLREHDDTLKSLKRDSRQAASLPEKLVLQKQIKEVETAREEAWRGYDAEAREVETAKDGLIDDVESRLAVDESVDRVFSIRFAGNITGPGDAAMTTTDLPQPFSLASELPSDDRLATIRAAFPEALRDGSIDFDTLRRSLGDWVDPGPERFGLTWPGKAECMRVIQEPSIGTLVPLEDESVEWDTTQNIIVEGENLEALKLLQKAYYGKVKLIYIDPPYNTGKEFIYPDNFREGLADYLRYSGQTDAEGIKLTANAETDGRYHSKWLSMMYPRLFLARNLLRDDGVIFVSIDDHEFHDLRAIMAEIFGDENFVASIVWQKRITPENRGVFSAVHDYVVCFARNGPIFSATRNLLPLTEEARQRYKNPDDDPRGDWLSVPAIAQAGHATASQFYELETPDGRCLQPPHGQAWRYTQSKMAAEIADGRVWFGAKGTGVPRLKRFLFESRQGLMPSTLWAAQDVGANEDGKDQLTADVGEPGLFDNAKPVGLIQRIVQLTTAVDEGDIILDFFAGSGTTATAVFEQNNEDGGNRSVLLVQLPESIEGHAERSIAAITRRRAKGAAARLKSQPNLLPGDRDFGFRAYQLQASNFSVWDARTSNPDEVAEQLALAAANHITATATEASMLTELLLKAGYPLTSRAERADFAGVEGYSVADGALLVCLAPHLSIESFEAMAERDPAMILALDAGFGGSDELKVNALQTVRARNEQSGSDITLRVV